MQFQDYPGSSLLNIAARPEIVFTHGDVAENRALMDEGVFPWWTSPDAC